MGETFLFTSESVSEGHPDKVSDQVSDAILDEIYKQDPQGRVACETMVATNLCVVAGEITFNGEVDYEAIARKTIGEIGYSDAASGIDPKNCELLVRIHEQSPDIKMGVDEGSDKEQGAGDQGMMFGYACNETPELMPAPIQFSHRLVEYMAKLRHEGKIKWLRPDSKSQVTVEYEDGQPKKVNAVVISTQHTPDMTPKQDEVREAMIEEVIKKVIPAKWLTKDTEFFVNPTGNFEVGGPHGDCGLTGRKIIVDTYGGMGRHGGGAFSGKDPSKVDRSAAYATRHVAKNVVAAGLADRAEVQVAYAIGVAKPVSINVNTFGTGKISENEIIQRIRKVFDMRPAALIERLQLRRPIFRQTAAYGHFGRELDDFTWEKTDYAEALKNA